MRDCTAPVNAPRVCPNSSASNSDSGIAAQFSTTNAFAARALNRCTAFATSSLPVPVSPSISTVVERGATSLTIRAISRIAALSPTISGNASARVRTATRSSGEASMTAWLEADPDRRFRSRSQVATSAAASPRSSCGASLSAAETCGTATGAAAQAGISS